MRYIACPLCGATNVVTLETLTVSCACGNVFTAHSNTVSDDKKSKNFQKKRSSDQERRAAKRDGARVTAASGATSHQKGDVVLPGIYRKECKSTIRDSFSIKRDVLDKICSEAKGTEIPVVEIEFQNKFPKKRFYVIPEWVFEEYVELKCK